MQRDYLLLTAVDVHVHLHMLTSFCLMLTSLHNFSWQLRVHTVFVVENSSKLLGVLACSCLSGHLTLLLDCMLHASAV